MILLLKFALIAFYFNWDLIFHFWEIAYLSGLSLELSSCRAKKQYSEVGRHRYWGETVWVQILVLQLSCRGEFLKCFCFHRFMCKMGIICLFWLLGELNELTDLKSSLTQNTHQMFVLGMSRASNHLIFLLSRLIIFLSIARDIDDIICLNNFNMIFSAL